MKNVIPGTAGVSPAMSAKRECLALVIDLHLRSAWRIAAGETPAVPAIALSSANSRIRHFALLVVSNLKARALTANQLAQARVARVK